MKNKLIELKVEGMNCNHCAQSLNRYLTRKGMEDVYVNYATCEVRYKDTEAGSDLQEIREGIADLGFQVVEEDDDEAHSGSGWWTLSRKLTVAAIFTIPLLLQHVLMMFGVHHFGPLDNYWVQMLIALPVFLIGLMHFGRSAWHSVKNGVPNMDVLIFIGSTAAFIYSLVGTVLWEANYIFYETSATIITLVLLGNYLEHRSVAQTTSAIEELGKLKVEKARRLNAQHQSELVPVKEVRVGDLLQVNEGDAIPLDAVVVSGEALIDESMLSGESIPVEKEKDDPVIGGSLVSSGHLKLRVTATGEETVLSKMIRLVKDAQQEKPDIQRLADRISAIFVPAVLVIALLTLLVSHFVFGVAFAKSLMNAIAVLVISCPCAMGLATPTAVMVGVGRVARNGILIRGGQTLEQFAEVKQMVFDKTGTLTTGDFKIEKIHYLGEDPHLVDAMIYGLEQHSSHPIAASLVRELEGRNGIYAYDFSSVQEQKGQGIVATDAQDNEYRLGSWKYISAALQHSESIACPFCSCTELKS
ncbi:MAG: cation-translocating P-type ATPase [Bacteroidota bacterium]